MSAQPELGRHGPYVTARLDGDVDVGDVEQVRLSILEALGSDAHGLIVDLSPTRYLDSAGVHMLFELARRLQERRQAMAIALPERSPLATLLQITNVDQAVPVRATVEGCAEALRDDPGLY